jgi:polyferredoxin
MGCSQRDGQKDGQCKTSCSPAASQDTIQLFKKQERIYPKKVKGTFRTLKWATMIVCLTFYYLAPFLRWDRGMNAPHQAILIDLQKGRAYWFWIEIWPQEVYILTGILVIAAIALFFVTSLFGRVWCGFLCFQTV